MPRTRRGSVQLAAYVDPKLKEWLERESRRLPPPQGQGKKETQRLSDYVRMVLEDHKKGGGYVGVVLNDLELAGVEAHRAMMKSDPEALDAFFRLGSLAHRFPPDVGYILGILADVLEAAYGVADPLAPGFFEKPTRTSRRVR